MRSRCTTEENHNRGDQGAVEVSSTHATPSEDDQTVAPYLLGQDPRETERHHHALSQGTMHRAMGAETRGLSAIDIALWDLFGQSVGLPIYRCLGGPVRERIRIYNTCAGYGYNIHKRTSPGRRWADSWGMGEHQGPYEDLIK